MKLAKIFSDGLILQRNKPVSVWGFSAVGEVVLMLSNGKKREVYRVKADENGEFCFTIKPHAGSYNPYVLRVENGDDVQMVNNVRFGEVYLTMGQSNMAYGVNAMVNSAEILNDARSAAIACFDVYEAYQQEDGSIFRPANPERDFAGNWRWNCGDSIELEKSSGVATMVALKLQKALGVPVGMINTALGGVSIDTYFPRAFADECPIIEKQLKKIDKYIPEGGEYNVYGGGNYTQLGGIYNEKIAPIFRFSVGGILWYQGENAVGDWDGAVYYRAALKKMISHYQDLFGKDVPFVCSQIALDHYPYGPYGYNYINEAIDLAVRDSKGKVESFPVYDVSMQWMKEDGLLYYHPIHPVDKRTIADRFARCLRALSKGEYTYPYIATVENKGSHLEAVVLPETVHLREGKVKGFAIAGADGKYVQADAEVIGTNRIKVYSPYVKQPQELTYAFGQYNNQCNLKLRDGEAVKPYRKHYEPWENRGYFQLNAFADCDTIEGTERCFGADLGCIGEPKMWTDGKITRAYATQLSIEKKGKEKHLCVRYTPTNAGYYYFGVSPEISIAGYEVPFDKFRYLTLRMKLETGGDVTFHGALVREGQSKLHRFVGRSNELLLTDTWQDYTLSLEQFVEGDLGVRPANVEARRNIHTLEFFFRSKTKGRLLIDSVRFHD